MGDASDLNWSREMGFDVMVTAYDEQMANHNGKSFTIVRSTEGEVSVGHIGVPIQKEMVLLVFCHWVSVIIYR